jgi:hypothetical protein
MLRAAALLLNMSKTVRSCPNSRGAPPLLDGLMWQIRTVGLIKPCNHDYERKMICWLPGSDISTYYDTFHNLTRAEFTSITCDEEGDTNTFLMGDDCDAGDGVCAYIRRRRANVKRAKVRAGR